MERKLFSIWLIPQQDQFDKLQIYINKLAKNLNAVSFIPHVTLFCGKINSYGKLKGCMEQIFRPYNKIFLDVLSLSYKESFYQTFFMELKNSSTLKKITHIIKTEIDPTSNYVFSPHLSLLYKKGIENKEKESLIQTNQNILNEYKTLYFDKIFIMTDTYMESYTAIKSWEIIAQIKI